MDLGIIRLINASFLDPAISKGAFLPSEKLSGTDSLVMKASEEGTTPIIFST